MVRDGKESKKPELGFDVWKSLLQRDCEMQDKLLPFQALGDPVLQILRQSGMNPTVEALLDGNSDET